MKTTIRKNNFIKANQHKKHFHKKAKTLMSKTRDSKNYYKPFE